RCAVTFAKQEEWRIPTFVAGEVEADEFSEGLYVTFYAEKFLGKFGGGGSRITGRHGVNHDDVAAIEQRVGIVFEAIRGGGHESIGLQYHPFGTERAHMEPHGSGAGPAIECEGERTLVSILTVERVGNEKHLRLDLAVAALDGKPAGGGGIGESLSIQAELVMRDHGRDFGDVVVFLFIGGLAVGFGRLLWLGGLRGLVRSGGAAWSCLLPIFLGSGRLSAVGRGVLGLILLRHCEWDQQRGQQKRHQNSHACLRGKRIGPAL